MKGGIMRPGSLVLALAIVACNDGATAPTGNARLRVVNTLPSVPALDVLVGDRVVIANLASGSASAVTAVPEGTQLVAFRPSGASAGPGTSLTLPPGDTTTILTVDSSSIINPWILSDSNATVPAGRTKLRVVHFAEAAPSLLAWRTQPDWGTFITIQFPFPYRTATPYVESDPGDWQVLVTTEAYAGGVPVMSDTLALSDVIPVPAGESRTVILMDDGAGGVKLVVIVP
jgi:hypothetical protein